ncbi:MAG: hypothetical protein KBT28_08000 [Bacteroidales bacterium]|nr:hypothetical protein [Candidatus Colimorpha merdihippi]
MKRIALLAAFFFFGFLCSTAWGQAKSSQSDAYKNLVIKEYKQKNGSKTSQLDQQTTYDALGRKSEVIEYASYGQKSRTVYEYDGNTFRISREIIYDDKGHVARIRKYEYNSNGMKKKQYIYRPDGNLISTKEFEYSHQ